jgi:electron transport complex protein RnfG
MADTEASSFRMIATLGVAGMLSGGLLVGAYLVTAPRIERNRAEALERAIYDVLPGAESNQPFVIRNDALVPFDGKGLPKKEAAVYAGFDAQGGFVGFAIPSEGSGFQDIIKLIYGYVPSAKRIIGMQVLESRETPGLGDKIMKDDKFLAQFGDLAVAPDIVATKKGKTQPHEIDAISGATISSKAVVKIINAGNAQWLSRLPATAPAAPAAAAAPGGAPAAGGK